MTQIFDESGAAIPVTVIKTEPLTVTQIKTDKTDGYFGIQVGYDKTDPSKIKKPLIGHLKKTAGLETEAFKHLKEFRLSSEDITDIKIGQILDAVPFEVGDKVFVSGLSKGKGFQGVVKRHGFKGGPRSHGQKHSEREPGSIGSGGVQRVFKGTRMAGRMGGDKITVKNLKIAAVDKDNNLLFVKGAIPGRRGTLLAIKS